MSRSKEIARLTGGKTYGAKDAHGAAQIFQDISAGLQHTYFLATKDDGWRQIQVSLGGAEDYKDCTVRSQEGY